MDSERSRSANGLASPLLLDAGVSGYLDSRGLYIDEDFERGDSGLRGGIRRATHTLVLSGLFIVVAGSLVDLLRPSLLHSLLAPATAASHSRLPGARGTRPPVRQNPARARHQRANV